MARSNDGPVRLTDGNRLYLYQLLGDRLGIGRQTFLPRAQEVLEQAGLGAEALGYADTRTLLEAAGSPFELTAFKGGRFYVTVTRDEAFDAALAKALGAKPAKASKSKPWKRKKGSLKPVRPKTLGPWKSGGENPGVANEAAAGTESAAPAGAADRPSASGAAKTGEDVAAAVAVGARTAAAAPAAGVASVAEVAAGAVGARAAAAAPVAAAPVAAAAQEPTSARGPARPETDTPRPAAPEPGEPMPILEQIAEQARLMGIEETPRAEGAASAGTQARADAAEAETPDTAAVAAAPPTAAPVPWSATAGSPAVATRPPAPAPSPQPAAPVLPAEWPHDLSREATMRTPVMALLTRLLPFDVDPLAVLDEDWRVARATGTAQGNRSRATFPLRYLSEGGTPVEVTIRRQARPGDARHWAVTLVDGDDGTGQAHEAAGIEGLPVADAGSWTDLAPRDAEAADPSRDLAQLLIIGTWEAALGALARAAAPERWNFPGEGAGCASRYGILREYLTLTLARIRAQGKLAKAADGSLAAFDTGLVTPALEPLYAVMEPSGVADITWRLAGFGPAGTGELGERLSATLGEPPARATYLEGIDDVVVRDDALVVPDYRELLGPGLSRLPRGLLADELAGTQAAGALEAAEAAGGQARHEALVALSRAIADEHGAYRHLCRALDDAIGLALLRARLSWRELAPAWDPTSGRMVLLAPLCLVDDARADCAVALALQPSGAYRAGSLVSLPRAYSLARVVCREMPAWLAADAALA